MVYSSVFDPNKPIFAAASPSTPAPTPNINRNNVPSTIPTIRPPGASGISGGSGVTASNIASNWTIVSLFGISFPRTNYYLLINASTITLEGGCNVYTYRYTINATTQLITIGNVSQTNRSCTGSDDQLFVSGITKMHKYLVSTSSTAHSLIFYDQAGTAGYSLFSRINATPTVIQVAGPNAFAAGQALMLVLQRRDLARSIVRITENTFTYTLCNTITHTYTVSTPGRSTGSITITGSATTNNANCAKSNDQVYITSLNSAISYVYDSNANTIVFSNKDGNEVVTFNRT